MRHPAHAVSFPALGLGWARDDGAEKRSAGARRPARVGAPPRPPGAPTPFAAASWSARASPRRAGAARGPAPTSLASRRFPTPSSRSARGGPGARKISTVIARAAPTPRAFFPPPDERARDRALLEDDDVVDLSFGLRAPWRLFGRNNVVTADPTGVSRRGEEDESEAEALIRADLVEKALEMTEPIRVRSDDLPPPAAEAEAAGVSEEHPRVSEHPTVSEHPFSTDDEASPDPLAAEADEASAASPPKKIPRSPRSPAPAMPIVFVTSEVAPWSKTGGLGDVCGALPAALAARGHAVVVVSPLYDQYRDAADTGVASTFWLDGGDQTVRYWTARRRKSGSRGADDDPDDDGVTYVFAQHPALQRGGGGKIYGHEPGAAYPDNDLRFALLSLAAIEAPLCLPWDQLFRRSKSASSEDSLGSSEASLGSSEGGSSSSLRFESFASSPVFVANDWHAALVPLFLRARYQSVASRSLAPRASSTPTPGAAAAMARATSVAIVHNLFHQGVFPSHRYRALGLPEEDGAEWFPALRWRWRDGGECMNFLKAGLSLARAAVLVSPAYAREVQTQRLGCGMDRVLRSVGGGGFVNVTPFANDGAAAQLVPPRVAGVVNGVDVDEWNPATDPHLAANYDVRDGSDAVDAGKVANKLALQRELGLEEDPRAPLVGFIGRLDHQKGVDVLLAAVPGLVARGAQVVMLGSGDPGLEHGLRVMEQNHRGRAVGWVGFSVPTSHRITAAADILAMPSRFEPCGLNQLYALRYGAIPVAHATGGLKDTVKPSVGFPFKPCDQNALSAAMDRCLDAYYARDSKWGLTLGVSTGVSISGRSRWRGIRDRGMRSDLGWDRAAAEYERVFRDAAEPAPFRLNRGGVARANEALAEACEAAAREEEEATWAKAERKAERARRGAARAPCEDNAPGGARGGGARAVWNAATRKLGEWF